MTDYDPAKAQYRKATKSGNGNACVEVATNFVDEHGVILVRDSKHPDVAPFTFNRAEWDAFIDGARGGEFDL